MQPLDIAMTSTSPEVAYDAPSCTLRISGESYPENSFEFYDPVMRWLREAVAAQDALRLDIHVSYMNSSSTKCMLDLLDILEEASAKGFAASVLWRYDSENPRALDLAEEFQEEVTFEFNLVPQE